MKEYFQNYRKILQSVVDKSEEGFEKKLIYIASGALGLSFSFISDIIQVPVSSFLWVLIIGWIFLILCILLNLISHISSKNKANKTIDDIDDFVCSPSEDDTTLRETINKRNQSTDLLNYITISMLILGIVSIIFFTSYNLRNSDLNVCATSTTIDYERSDQKETSSNGEVCKFGDDHSQASTTTTDSNSPCYNK